MAAVHFERMQRFILAKKKLGVRGTLIIALVTIQMCIIITATFCILYILAIPLLSYYYCGE